MSDQLRSIYALTRLVQQTAEARYEEAHREIRSRVPAAPSKYPDASINVVSPRRAPRGEGVDLAAAEYWLDHCSRLSLRMNDFDHDTRRGLTIACKILGLGWNNAQQAIGAARTSGVAPAAAVWAPYMSAPDERYVGLVYVARHETDRGILKVGFTTDLAKRMRSLSRLLGEIVVAVNSLPGTALNEWALHMDLSRSVMPEWYPAERVPEWLLHAIEPEVAV